MKQKTKFFNRQSRAHVLWLLLLLPLILTSLPQDSRAAGPTYVSGNITGDTTWAKDGSPYIVTGNVTVRNGAQLIISPGVTVKFNKGKRLNVSRYDSSGALSAVGTPEEKIVFTSNAADPAPGDWGRIEFERRTITSDKMTYLKYCTIEYGGSSENGNIRLYKNNGVIISNCEVRYSGSCGLKLLDAYPTITGCKIYANQSHGIYSDNDGGPHPAMTIVDNEFADNGRAAISTNAYINSISGSIGSGDGPNYIQIRNGSIKSDCTWEKGLPYVITDSVTIQDGALLTISPGVTVKFNKVESLNVSRYDSSGGLYAVGTPEEKIVFTSNAADPAPGDWYRINFDRNTITSDGPDKKASCLRYCTIEYGGYGGYGNIRLYKNNGVIISNCEV
ncbi:MAG: right-handed parallel beta-helix repeat-containing protein, partial [Desulfosudaceae bacterium]